MIKYEKYTGEKTYMYPNGKIATKEVVLQDFPAALTYVHIVETDESGEVMWGFQNLSALASLNNLAKARMSEEELIKKLEEIRNAPPPAPKPSAEDRIAAALEYQNVMAMKDVQ